LGTAPSPRAASPPAPRPPPTPRRALGASGARAGTGCPPSRSRRRCRCWRSRAPSRRGCWRWGCRAIPSQHSDRCDFKQMHGGREVTNFFGAPAEARHHGAFHAQRVGGLGAAVGADDRGARSVGTHCVSCLSLALQNCPWNQDVLRSRVEKEKLWQRLKLSTSAATTTTTVAEAQRKG
jgi:hypothetical protein